MQSSDNSFNRVKSLLGKLDRSIDDARRRRLTDPDDLLPQVDQDARCTQTERDQTGLERADPCPAPELDREPAPRSSSKYGRARPIRELPGSSAASWQTT